MSDPAIRIADMHKYYGNFHALKDINLKIEKGEKVVICGPSGSGKSTLIRCINRLEEHQDGVIEVNGTPLDDNVDNIDEIRREAGMVFQNFNLFPHMTVLENCTLAPVLARKIDRGAAEETAMRYLARVKIPEQAHKYPGELSGGQRQRVAIARALAQEPEVFLLDEPMSALDAKLREEMQVELRLLQQRLGITTIVVTHDQREAMTMADQIVVMSNGRVEQIAHPQEIYHKPANAFVADFIGKANFFDGICRDGGVLVGDSLLQVNANFLAGSPVRIAIRPERTCIDDDPGENRVPAKVMFVRDLGPIREYHLQSYIGPIIAEYAAGETNPQLKNGDETSVRLPAAALQVFPGAAA